MTVESGNGGPDAAPRRPIAAVTMLKAVDLNS